MSCDQFSQCVCSLKREEKPVKKEKRKNKKREDIPKPEYIYTGSSCRDKDRISQCVCFLDKRTRPTCAENGKTYTLFNRKPPVEVLCMHIDKGVLGDEDGTRCDYAFFVRDKADQGQGRMVLIELKGKAVEKALAQLQETLKLPEVKKLAKSYKRVYGRVAFAASPPRIRSTDQFFDLNEEFIELNGNLKIGEMNFEEKYEELDNTKRS